MKLSVLKERTGAGFVFEVSEGKKEFEGDISGDLERVYLVLKQTIDALGENPFKELIIEFKDGNLVISGTRDGFVGIFVSGPVDVNEIRKAMIEAEEAEKAEVVEAEKVEEVVEEAPAEAPAPEAVEVEETPVEAPAPPVEEKVEVLGDEVVEQLKGIAGNYLGDFAEEIFMNVWGDEGMDGKEKTRDNLIEFIYALQRSASMIIGPSKAQSMAEEMIEKVKQG